MTIADIPGLLSIYTVVMLASPILATLLGLIVPEMTLVTARLGTARTKRIPVSRLNPAPT